MNSTNATSVNTLMQQQQHHLQQQHNSTFNQISTSMPSSSSAGQHTLILPPGMVQVISSNSSSALNGMSTPSGGTINGYFSGTAGGTGNTTHYVVQQQQQTNAGVSYQQQSQQQNQQQGQPQTIIVPYSGAGNGQSQPVQQMVQATINGTTVLIPANSQQYTTFVLNPSTSTASGSGSSQISGQQIIVHHAVPAGSNGQQHTVQQQSQQVYVQYNGTSTSQVLNGLPQGTSYVTAGKFFSSDKFTFF